MGRSNEGASHRLAAISDRFKNTGVKAGTAKRPTLFRMPPASAVNEMKKMYGKVTRNKSAVSACRSGLFMNPGAKADTSSGAAMTPVTVISIRTVSYTHLRAHETDSYLVCRLLLE